MNIVLTGARGAGKSTLARRLIESLGIEPGGFVTGFDDRARPDRALLIGDGRDMRPVVRFDGYAPCEVHADVFDGYGCELIAQPASVILMDELGRFESGAMRFQAAVLAALDGDVPVLAVVQKVEGPCWLDAVLAHRRARVEVVTEQNRDALYGELAAQYRNEVMA